MQDADNRQPVGSSRLEDLLQRMRQNSDFPAMSEAISSINRLTASANADAATLANAILKDLALTNKILRLANSAYYSSFGGRVGTVSRAIVILGFDAIRNLAISLMLFDQIRDRRQAQKLCDEVLRANLCGNVARAISRRLGGAGDSEQAFICGLFHSLGRLATQFYLPEESNRVERLVASGQHDEDAAAKQVLGVTYPTLGVSVAKLWGFPRALVNSMRPLPRGVIAEPRSPDEMLHLVASCAAEFSDDMQLHPPGGNLETRRQLARRYAAGLALDDKALLSVADEALDNLRTLADALSIRSSGALAQLLGEAEMAPPAEAPDDPLQSFAPEAAASDHDAGRSPEAVLAGGIQDISQSLVDESTTTADVLRAIAEIIFRALGARRVLVCLRDPAGGEMRGRYGFGEDVEQALRQMHFPIGGSDLFNLILAREVDVLVSDRSADKIRRHLPDWFARDFSAQSFIVLPLRLGDVPVAMIYAESPLADGIRVGDEALGQLRTLRNQALLAIKLNQ